MSTIWLFPLKYRTLLLSLATDRCLLGCAWQQKSPDITFTSQHQHRSQLNTIGVLDMRAAANPAGGFDSDFSTLLRYLLVTSRSFHAMRDKGGHRRVQCCLCQKHDGKPTKVKILILSVISKFIIGLATDKCTVVPTIYSLMFLCWHSCNAACALASELLLPERSARPLAPEVQATFPEATVQALGQVGEDARRR